MVQQPHTRHLVPFDDSFRVADAHTAPPPKAMSKKDLKAAMADNTNALADLQDLLYAHDKHAILLVFQAMDAAGKDSTIRAVLSGINPAGFQVFSFKKPSDEELDHDFLWRTASRLPERGRIGVFNRSYYEETLVVQVHPGYLQAQKLPAELDLAALWQQRYDSIRDHERHLARNGTVVLKFWLNISRREQLERFRARVESPDKNWKFAAGDVKESRSFDAYMRAYEDTLNATSRPWAPWYAIPADDKPYMRWAVSDILRRTLEGLDLSYPTLDADDLAQIDGLRAEIDRDLAEMKKR